MHITVPPVPKDLDPADCRRQLLTGLNWQKNGAARALGPMLNAGDTIDLPAGALVLTVDKSPRGWEKYYQPGKQRIEGGYHSVKDATVTAYLVWVNRLAEVWSRQYIRDDSAFGNTTIKNLEMLLERHPAPTTQVVVVREAWRPNVRDGQCRWCSFVVMSGLGQVVGQGKNAKIEHHESCPPAPAKTGEVCGLCGVSVVGHQAARYYLRNGTGGTQVRHKLVNGCTCLEQPVPSLEEQEAARVAHENIGRASAARQQVLQEEKENARLKRKEGKRAEWNAEVNRIAGLKTVSVETRGVYDKALMEERRACLEEHTGTLSDGSTTQYWTVKVYREKADGGKEILQASGPLSWHVARGRYKRLGSYRTIGH